MDFDLDDPLGDLLSDGSNDSFFGTTKTKTETVKPAKQTGDTKSKSKVANLFGFDSEQSTKPNEKLNLDLTTPPNNEPKKTINKDESTIDSRTNRRQTPEKNVSTTAIDTSNSVGNIQKKTIKKETRFDDSDDFLDELGFDPKYPKGTAIGSAKKSNILDDILNFGKNEPAPKPAPMPKTTALGDSSDKRSSRTIDSNPNTNRYSPSSRRQSRNLPRSGSLEADPLGLFSSSSTQETKKDENVPSTRLKPTKKPTVDWLGLEAQTDVKSDEINVVATDTQIKNVETSKSQESITKNATNLIPPSTTTSITPVQLPVNVPTVTNTTTADNISASLNMINMASLEKETALNSLQQQQTQLRVATQMKQQENILYDVHMKQELLLKQQEKQFNELLRRQVDRQSQLETQIQRQQDQINAYINVLMNQPSMGLMATKTIPTETASANDKEQMVFQQNEEDASHQNIIIELEALVKRLELDKLRLEDTLQNIQTSHEQELELLHISHKKQIMLLEESLGSLEKRLREEIKSTEAYHLNKITALQTDIESQRQKYEDNIEKLINDYEKQIEKIRLNYEQDLEVLKNEQRSTIENIRQAKLYEFATLQESGSYLSTLKSASDNLEHATDNLQSMRVNITSTIERIHSEREVQLNAKEQRLNDQQKNIEKTIEKTEEERTRLIELVKSLEIKLNSVEQSSAEEQWNFRQKSAALEAERVSFEREKNFTREKLGAEEKRVQEMKEMQFAENKRLMELLDAEREQILIEKAKLETMERLKVPTNPTVKRQSELDAAIKIAQDAAKSADAEREKLIEQQRKHEFKKRELLEKERMLQAQQNEVEIRINEAKDQKQIAEHTTKTCQTIEKKLLAKLQSLQENYMELTERETKLSQTKMELGKERVELQQMRQQLRQSKCSLCRIGYKNAEISELDPLNDISIHNKSMPKFDFLSSNSFEGLQQRLSNVDSMIDEVINVPQSSMYNLNSSNSPF
ncbi:interaptin [Contarinia nasturtii]|uniref:interaptin n=1 Tax=Contarinia nasturtii TaxID=265458 RepID=UPI0012D37F71|nr:interaptin [Contarinia nasturtii]